LWATTGLFGQGTGDMNEPYHFADQILTEPTVAIEAALTNKSRRDPAETARTRLRDAQEGAAAGSIAAYKAKGLAIRKRAARLSALRLAREQAGRVTASPTRACLLNREAFALTKHSPLPCDAIQNDALLKSTFVFGCYQHPRPRAPPETSRPPIMGARNAWRALARSDLDLVPTQTRQSVSGLSQRIMNESDIVGGLVDEVARKRPPIAIQESQL
jgi:hypothetical protein